MIRNIWAVGRNYADHAKELGNPLPKEPLIFLKAGSCAVKNTPSFRLSPWASEIHHEIEVALRFGDDLSISSACVALDLTDRPRQSELKSRGEPWTLAKSFSGACPISDFFEVKSLDEISTWTLNLEINGQTKQHAPCSQMIFNSKILVDFVRKHFPVCPGDLLLTGTPEGVGPLHTGDVVMAEIVGKIRHHWQVI